MKKCPRGSRKNKKTGICEPNVPTTIPGTVPTTTIPVESTSTALPKKKCPKGTRKNKKTGICEPNVPATLPETVPTTTMLPKSYVPKPDWETLATTITKKYKGKSYQYIVVPKNTYIYRGFTYGENPYYNPENPRIRLKPDDPYFLEIKRSNEEDYQRFKNGLYYGNLGVGCFYAYDQQSYTGIYNNLQEYITKKTLYFLDMNNWQNLKNIVDTYNQENSQYNMQSILEICYDFDINNPLKPLYRDSGASDKEMTKAMLQWLEQSKSLKIHGFGDTKINGFHSEIVCVDKNNLKLVKEYKSDNYKEKFMTNINDKNDILPLENISFIDDNKIIYIIKR